MLCSPLCSHSKLNEISRNSLRSYCGLVQFKTTVSCSYSVADHGNYHISIKAQICKSGNAEIVLEIVGRSITHQTVLSLSHEYHSFSYLRPSFSLITLRIKFKRCRDSAAFRRRKYFLKRDHRSKSNGNAKVKPVLDPSLERLGAFDFHVRHQKLATMSRNTLSSSRPILVQKTRDL